MKRITLVLTVAIIGLSFVSCKKYGCTDPDAINFEDKVRSDNLTCEYQSSIVFWYDEIIMDSILNAQGPILFLEYFIDGERVDSVEFDNELSEPPPCGENEELGNYTSEMGKGFKKFVKYQIYTNFDALLYDSIVELTANQCLKIRFD